MDFNNENYCIILENKIYSQRTPTSKFIEFSLDGVKTNTYEELPDEIKEIIKENNNLQENPDKYLEYEITSDGIEIKAVKNFKSNFIKIPSHIKNKPVTTIGTSIFKNHNRNIKQIQLPETITHFSKMSFCGLIYLEHINIPKSVKVIPEYCFDNCRSLQNLDFSHIESIQASAFMDCRFKKLTLDNVKFLGSHAFANCKHLEKLEILSDIVEIKYYTFNGCILLSDITLPDTITTIGNHAFGECSSLETFTAPKDLILIEKKAFFNNMLKEINLNENLQEIEEDAFFSNLSVNDLKNQKINIYSKTSYHKYSFSGENIHIVDKNNELER